MVLEILWGSTKLQTPESVPSVHELFLILFLKFDSAELGPVSVRSQKTASKGRGYLTV